MKYILPESLTTKYIFQEKYILTEDDESNNRSFLILQKNFTALKNIVDRLNLDTTFKDNVESFNNAVPDTKKDIPEIADIDAVTQELIDTIIPAINTFVKDDEAVAKAIKEIKAAAIDGFKLKDYEKDFDDLAAEFKTNLPAELDKFSKSFFDSSLISTEDNKFEEASFETILPDIKANLENLKQILNNLNTIQNTLTTLKTKITKEAEKEKDIAADTAESWEDRLANAAKQPNAIELTDKIWEEYYTVEWGENANYVKSLGFTFKQELLNMGFSETSNPFITFIKYSIGKFVLNDKNYVAIHNAYVQDFISKKDLRGVEKTANDIGYSNIIYNQKLYTQDPTVILNYLKQQSFVLEKYKSNKIDGFLNIVPDATKNAELTAIYKDAHQLICALFLAGYKLDEFTEISNTKETMANGILKNLSLIKDLCIQIFGEGEPAANWDSSVGKVVVDHFTKADLFMAIKYLTIKFLLKFDDVKKLSDWKELQTVDGKTYDLSKNDRIGKFFDGYDIKASNIKKVLTDILTAGKAKYEK